MNGIDYKEAYSYEAYGDYGGLGIRVDLAMKRELTDKDKRILAKAVDAIYEGVMEETVSLIPETVANRIIEREEIIGLFNSVNMVYVEEIPNGYCSQWCCKQKPWFVVTTKRGRIKLGWRKRVLEINWNDSNIKHKADEIFPNDNVTKFDKLIHAWGYDKAREYINVLMQAQ